MKLRLSFQLSNEDNTFVINHVKTDIQWERFVFFGWNVFKPHQFVWCFKEDMLNSVGMKPIGGKTKVVQKNESLVLQMS